MNKHITRRVVSILMILLYLGGLVCFFLSMTEAGIGLWAMSTVGGGLWLFFIRRREEEMEEAGKDQEDEPPCE